MARIGIYADDEYLDDIDRRAHELRISQSKLVRIALDHLIGLPPPKKFGLDQLLIEITDDPPTNCQNKNPRNCA